MRRRIGAGTVAGLIAAALVDVVVLGRTVTTTDGSYRPILAVVAGAAHAHGWLARA